MLTMLQKSRLLIVYFEFNMKDKTLGKYNSKTSGKAGREKASMRDPNNNGPSGATHKDSLTQHHGNVGKSMAKKMSSDPVADTRKIANG